MKKMKKMAQITPSIVITNCMTYINYTDNSNYTSTPYNQFIFSVENQECPINAYVFNSALYHTNDNQFDNISVSECIDIISNIAIMTSSGLNTYKDSNNISLPSNNINEMLAVNSCTKNSTDCNINGGLNLYINEKYNTIGNSNSYCMINGPSYSLIYPVIGNSCANSNATVLSMDDNASDVYAYNTNVITLQITS